MKQFLTKHYRDNPIVTLNEPLAYTCVLQRLTTSIGSVAEFSPTVMTEMLQPPMDAAHPNPRRARSFDFAWLASDFFQTAAPPREIIDS